jgi:alkanesulfonate monooxygenase SsuD/methylene tetrahydromethanopterin reductase-like flavin-dependent oxidoreductase (luciferase family)
MVIRRLLDGDRVTHHGRFYELRDALCTPRPIQQPMPILIGGSGPTKTLRTTAHYANRWNGYGTPERIAATSEVLRQRCDEVGRPFAEIERTVTTHIVVRDSVAEAGQAWLAVAERHALLGKVGSDGTDRGLTVGGPPLEVAAYLDRYRRIGAGEVMVVFREPFDVETIERIGEVRAELELIAV